MVAPVPRPAQLTCHDGAGGEEDVVRRHHGSRTVQSRGLTEEPRAERRVGDRDFAYPSTPTTQGREHRQRACPLGSESSSALDG